ncbi:MAG: aromatic-ring-hydroxylating dioxygenase subunit beta [Pigmentiphaga sp.]|uniref:aromatic-ring-hydroxylating dioxygenase subunit beta n=1 Tax=Pigmentiphaga sp. TaxID=1977564 RepID=UPI0029A5CCAC|nr:aromatic-ring-hydroxylating dioxygenase subunit beta [Pigmentiphaga sp.]MDX3905741.1 aromatic-ring-hydroxylating dioxygenase subunit beta [Pigmentiphaga sp.]
METLIAPTEAWTRKQQLRMMIEEFHGDYAATLDSGHIEQWPAYFTDDAVYRVIARDNWECGLPLCLMLCDGRGMLEDRAYAIAHTEMYAPRYVQHQISLTRILGVDEQGIEAQANYAIYETLIDEPTRLLQVGRYSDTFVLRGGRLLLSRRDCVYDTVLVPNCQVFPV